MRIDFLRPILFFFGLILLVSCRKQELGSPNLRTADLNTNLVLMPATTDASPVAPGHFEIDPKILPLKDALWLESQGQLDPALERINSVLQSEPRNPDALCIRSQIYSRMKKWELAQKDIEAVLQIDPKNSLAKFNLVELKFMQKAYDEARPGFVALESDPDLSDLAAYRIFLCDLWGGHEEVAQSELDAFNKAGSNPSFYFANAAWYLYHKRPEDARSWLDSAESIYAPWKASRYLSSLSELGYLPLPPLTK